MLVVAVVVAAFDGVVFVAELVVADEFELGAGDEPVCTMEEEETALLAAFEIAYCSRMGT